MHEHNHRRNQIKYKYPDHNKTRVRSETARPLACAHTHTRERTRIHQPESRLECLTHTCTSPPLPTPPTTKQKARSIRASVFISLLVVYAHVAVHGTYTFVCVYACLCTKKSNKNRIHAAQTVRMHTYIHICTSHTKPSQARIPIIN